MAFVQVLQGQFVQSELAPEADFRNLPEWSSLQALVVITTIDEAYGVVLLEQDLDRAKTLEDLYQITLQKLAAHGTV
ncbi:MAG: acyl carrier protein [Bacteroidota bacterium]